MIFWKFFKPSFSSFISFFDLPKFFSHGKRGLCCQCQRLHKTAQLRKLVWKWQVFYKMATKSRQSMNVCFPHILTSSWKSLHWKFSSFSPRKYSLATWTKNSYKWCKNVYLIVKKWFKLVIRFLKTNINSKKRWWILEHNLEENRPKFTVLFFEAKLLWYILKIWKNLIFASN